MPLAVACAQTGSLTAAARDCNIVLAAASRRIRELESALDDLVAELADIRQGIARHIRLCASTAAINQFLPPLLARYADQHADVRVDVDDAVGHMVASGLGIAVLPRQACLPIIRAMKLARRQLQVAIRPDADAAIAALRDFLCAPSRNAKTASSKRK